MRTWFALCLLALYAFAAQAQTTEETRTLQAFDRLEAGHNFQIELVKSDKESLSLTCKGDISPQEVVTEVSKGELRLTLDNKRNIRGSWQIQVTVYYRELKSIDLSGASALRCAESWKGTDLSLECSGASTFKGDVQASTLKVDGSGASVISITGQTGTLSLDLSGASSLKGEGFLALTAAVEGSGASNATLQVKESLSAELSGASKLHYKGTPRMEKMDTSGASTVRSM